MIRDFLCVAVGGALGASARYGMSVLLLQGALVSRVFISTLIVNLLGSFLIGLLSGAGPISRNFQLFMATGILGGFTTFSAFGLECFYLLKEGEWGICLTYVLLSFVGGTLSVVAGFKIGESIF